ncbi:hypothetical protein TNIN_288191 [Trichonephila inaurata madagascariensis]|uniref:Uncharacterized protein n=1 Tax=Trichonephila inaurata madagascariensis TaxID=2747483 RepID=A0A8X6MEZ8_9ARAC|nr:hypothetical protein TNIN_288191 [Trichonephila inaurata madagascariensis]
MCRTECRILGIVEYGRSSMFETLRVFSTWPSLIVWCYCITNSIGIERRPGQDRLHAQLLKLCGSNPVQLAKNKSRRSRFL